MSRVEGSKPEGTNASCSTTRTSILVGLAVERWSHVAIRRNAGSVPERTIASVAYPGEDHKEKVAIRYIVDDVGEAIDFYRDLLGIEVDMHSAPGSQPCPKAMSARC
jgi:hypothetical protein